MDKIQDYDYNLDLLLEQYKESPNFKALLEADNVQANDLEDALFEIRDLFTLATAEGVQLDTIGEVLLLERQGRNDDDYRAAIQSKVALSTSGTPEAIIGALKALFGGTFVRYVPEYPGKFRISTDATITLEQLQELAPAGVQGLFSEYLIDAVGNSLVDYFGNRIIQVNLGQPGLWVDGNGESIVDGNDDPIQGFELII